MFPSSGLFADQHCPFALRGLCERPHCLYKHAPEVLDAFGASCKSSIVEFAGLQNGRLYAACGAPVNNETKDDCHHELERINKEIETVRHEVEQERRRLSRYQTVQAESRNNTPVSTRETTGEGVDGLPPYTDDAKTRARAKKYVVDNSKPRTDLEYDPLSNFSADLRSFSSSGKEQKVKIGKRDRKQPTTRQALLSQSPSPEPLDDSNEDDVLIIDVPLSPDQTRDRCASSQISGDTVKTPQHGSASRVDSNKTLNYSDSENNLALSALNHNKECGNIAANQSVLDSTGCLVDTERECQKTTGVPLSEPVVVKVSEAACLPAASDCQDNSRSSSAEKMNQQQKTKNSPFYKGPAANSSQRQQAKQAEAPEQPAQTRVHSYRPPEQHSVPQKMSNKMSVHMEDRASVIHRSSAPRQEPAEPASGPSTHLSTRTASSSSSERLFMTVDNEPVIIVDSSSDEEEEQQQQDDELNYSDLELSDSDPMEECYRIFMEANNEEKGDEEQPNVSIVSVEKPEVNVTPKELPVKKRVAHEAKHTEQPVVKSRPQPQVLVPLRDPAGSGSRPSFPPRIQQVQQRASMLTASVKGGQVFVSSTCQKRPDTQSGISAPAKPPEHLQPAPVQNAVNLIPLGTTVIDMGNNLHLILPEGTFPLPVTSTSSPITSVLTPITQVNNTGTFTVRPSHHPPTVIPVQRYHSTAPVLIPAPARKPSLTSAFASASLHSSPAASTTTQAAAKPMPVKRKLKQQCDATKDKVPHNVRQRYVNMFTEEFLKTADNVNDAFTKALAEERTVFNRSVNKLKYLSVAVNALKRLKNQSAAAAKNENKVSSQRLKGNIPLNPKKLKTNVDDVTLYECLKDYILTDEMLSEHNYPVQHPEKHGCAVLFADNKKVNTDPLKRICCRCGATYSVSQTGKHTRKEECNYHYGRGVTRRVPGGVETRYSCCEGVMGAPGCQVFKLHVHDSLSLDGFVSTVPRCLSDGSCPGVYALDCEMCYTINGLELSRVTVVSSSLEVIYDTFVKPDDEVIDYNTRFSGISEDDVEGNHTSLRVVQETLLSFISAGTVLIGHGLETDLCLLKLLHGTIVDTSVVFPHRLGPPHKLSLHHLTTEYLRRIIQESVCGHDTAEDAAACMELMLWKLKEDGKLKK